MPSYRQWMHDWETRLTSRDTNRVVRPLDWGVEWARSWPQVNGNFPSDAADLARCENFLHDLNAEIVRDSDSFFSYRMPRDFRVETREVTWPGKEAEVAE